MNPDRTAAQHPAPPASATDAWRRADAAPFAIPAPQPSSTASSTAHADTGAAPAVRAAGGQWAARLADLLISSVALLIFSPLMLLIVCAIKIDSPGPVLFRQKRVGMDRRSGTAVQQPAAGGLDDRRTQDQYGKPIYLYKFRTMYVDARERFPDLYRYEYREGELDSVPIKVLVGHRRIDGESQGFEHADNPGNDPRVTRVGRWLRRTSLDELPNFLSVLGGDMTLVGPRPDIVENVRWYQRRHLLKFRVKPGVTGLAQVSGRGNLSFHDTNELDVEYVKSRSMLGDIRIMLRTIWATLTRNGAF